MAIGFFANYRVYLLTTVAYMGSLLFGKAIPRPFLPIPQMLMYLSK
jgi:hypothetical protein